MPWLDLKFADDLHQFDALTFHLVASSAQNCLSA